MPTQQNEPATRSVPVAKLDVAEENVRHGEAPKGIDALAANIARHGLMQPLVVYELKGRFKVIAGARRLAAIKKCGTFEAVPVVVRDRADAIALSIAENDQRVAMHPAEEARAWAGMIAQGDDVKAIANAYGKTEQFVAQRVALASLHPPIFDALAGDKITLAVAKAYASSPPERQARVWKKLGVKGTEWNVRNELGAGAVEADDELAIFVGRKAYLAAGGVIEGNLFADEAEGRRGAVPDLWLNRALLDKLADEKLKAEAKKLEAEGWSFVHTGKGYYSHGAYSTISPCKTREQKSKAGCYVRIDHSGKLAIERNLVRGKTSSRSVRVTTLAGKGAKNASAPKMTNTAHEAATRIAGKIVGHGLWLEPDVAIIALTAQLARMHFKPKLGEGNQNVLAIEFAQGWAIRGSAGKAPVDLNKSAATVMAEQEKQIRDQLAPHWATLETHLATWAPGDVRDLLAYFIGMRVSAPEMNASDTSHKPRRARLAALGDLCNARQRAGELWTPDKAWLMGLRPDVLKKICGELGIPHAPKKGVMAQAIAEAAARKNWCPPLVLELISTGPAASKVAKPAKAARKVRP